MSSAILYIEWNFVRPWFVRSWSYYFCTFSTTVRTNLSYMCSTEVKKKWTTGIRWDTGLRRGMRHGKSVVHSSTGTSRPRSKALKTHLLYRSKSICPQTVYRAGTCTCIFLQRWCRVRTGVIISCRARARMGHISGSWHKRGLKLSHLRKYALITAVCRRRFTAVRWPVSTSRQISTEVRLTNLFLQQRSQLRVK